MLPVGYGYFLAPSDEGQPYEEFGLTTKWKPHLFLLTLAVNGLLEFI